MRLFSELFYQHKGGKGVTAPPPTKGIKRFLFLAYTHFWRLVGLNMLFILVCLLVVTIPPAITAMNKVLITLAREGNVFFVKDFFDEFKSSFLKSWIAFVPWLIIGAVGVSGYLAIVDVYRSAMQIVLFVMLCSLLYCYTNYCFSMLALIDLPIGKIMKNAAIMVLSEIRRNVFMVITSLAFILCAVTLPYSIPVILFFVFSFAGLANMMIANEAIEERVIKPNFNLEVE